MYIDPEAEDREIRIKIIERNIATDTKAKGRGVGKKLKDRPRRKILF